MKSPLVLAEDEYQSRKDQFSAFDKAHAMQCVESVEPIGVINKLRSEVEEAMAAEVRRGGPKQSLTWGPVVRSEAGIAQWFAVGNDEIESTDGVDRGKPIPETRNEGVFNAIQSALKPKAPPVPATVHYPTPIYRVKSCVEVTPEQILHDLAGEGKHTYIRGEIIVPKLRVEV